MRITLSKFIPAKLEFDDPAADGVPPWALPLPGGSFKKETNLDWNNGGSR
jgi:hypothetical protein